MKSGFQLFIANYYPCCPQPELALGMPPHSDHGLLTLIIQNQVGGLQVQHQGKWIHVNALPNSLLVNTGDHLEIFSNGKYKSNVHKVVVNNTSPRISVAVAHGPSLEAIVSPASPLVQSETNYIPMKYKDYMEMQQMDKPLSSEGREVAYDRPSTQEPFKSTSNEDNNVYIAGYVLFYPCYSGYFEKPGFFIENMFVRECYRKCGFGKMLFSAVASQANKIGFTKVDWLTVGWNENAIDFYLGMGAYIMQDVKRFRLSGEGLDAFAKNDQDGGDKG
ncbi:hypothetical protein RDI58_019336 [Solanum bulbocastanum]|uniref:Fe2OG dioxygenase domain-containing protein n=1 Tax=Solanum bulbocastanum TaxID=147425 RepID=A0AAN8Y6F6_SOLBU